MEFSLYEGIKKKLKVLTGEGELINLSGRQLKDVNYVLGIQKEGKSEI